MNFIDDSLASELGITVSSQRAPEKAVPQVNYQGTTFGVSPELIFQYGLDGDPRCSSVLTYAEDVRGYKCRLGKGSFYQLGAVFYREFNSNEYADMTDSVQRVQLLRSVLNDAHIAPAVQVEGNNDRVVAFSRHVPERPERWITVKSGRNDDVQIHVRVRDVHPRRMYRIRDLFNGQQMVVRGSVLRDTGFPATLTSFGSTVFWIEPRQRRD